MTEIGRIVPEKKLGCPACHAPLDDAVLESLRLGEPCRCAGCAQQLRLPKELLDDVGLVAEVNDGGAEQVTVTAEKLECPACPGNLVPYHPEGSSLVLDMCPTCRGMWFDRDELRDILASEALRAQFRLPPSVPRTVTRKPERHCARCVERPLNERDLRGVAIDECSKCWGIWLDAGELTRLIDVLEGRESAAPKPSDGDISGKTEAETDSQGKDPETPVSASRSTMKQVSDTVLSALKGAVS